MGNGVHPGPRAWHVAAAVVTALLGAAGNLGAQQVMTNTAGATYQTFAGTDSVVSNPVQTTLVVPQISLEKTLSGGGPQTARVGQQFDYSLAYGNASATVPAFAAVLSDTLPDGLEFVSSMPMAQIAGQVLTWSLGDLQPGDSGSIRLTVRVHTSVRDTVRAVNTAFLEAQNAPMETAVAPEVQLIGEPSAVIALDKSADMLEVGAGEHAPYTLTVSNSGVVPLSNIQIRDLLPVGAVYVKGSATGADSVRTNGRSVRFFIAGPLAPGESHTVHYAIAIVSPTSTNLQNRAIATAMDQSATSSEVSAFLRVRTAWPMETRAAIGKVWVDVNDDGIQDLGEPGLHRVDIWTDDGEIATTDDEGRFSYRNLRAGHHGFRLDPATLPAEFRLAGYGLAEDLVVKNADGWTTPRVNFRLIPRGGTIAELNVPVPWQVTARPRCPNRPDSAPGSDGTCRPERVVQTVAAEPEAPVDSADTDDRVVLKGVEFEFNRSAITAASAVVLDEVAASLRQHPRVRVEVGGHTDGIGDPTYNRTLSEERAAAVMGYLLGAGIDAARLEARGYGAARPVADNATDEGRARNRRVELQLLGAAAADSSAVALKRALLSHGLEQGAELLQFEIEPLVPSPPPTIEVEATIGNPYNKSIEGLIIEFSLPIDSAALAVGDAVATARTTGPLVLPSIPGGASLRVVAWGQGPIDSVTALLRGGEQPPARLVARVHNPLLPVGGIKQVRSLTDSLPEASVIPADAEVVMILRPPLHGWPGEATFGVPPGWQYVPGSARLDSAPMADPDTVVDRTGEQVLLWRPVARAARRLAISVQPVTKAQAVDSVRIAALRDPEERERELGRSFVAGPGVRIFQPTDGRVFPSDRVFIGVKGEANAPIALFIDDSLYGQPNLRPDGVHDFIAVPLAPGPHRLKVRMMNSWQKERWDSVAVHVTGVPTRFVVEPGDIRVTAGSEETTALRVRVLDQWDVPVANGPFVTVTAEGAEVIGTDRDASSVGTQLQPDHGGWMTVVIRGGRDVRRGALTFAAGKVSREVPVDVLPAIRPLMVTGVGRVGVGATPDASGSLTARGRLDDRTSIVLSYDSRKLDAGRDFFARGSDPLEEAQYPLLGDASLNRVVGGSRSSFAARVQRGYDWITLGDIETDAFAQGLQLTRYRRALTGAGAHVTTGPVTWQGFTSSTRESLQQLQVRGAGVSGPYDLATNIKPGTEQIVIETRARENPTRVLTRQVLIRFVDYQIDYDRGTLLLKRPVPAADVYENPVFILATFEAESGGARSLVWGLRATANATSLIERMGSLDSLRVGASWIRDGQPGGDRHMVGADLQLVGLGGATLGGEVSYASSPDSSGVATALTASTELLGGALRLDAAWQSIGSGFHNPSDIGLRSGSKELRLGGRSRIGAADVRLEHERQSFDGGALTRRRTVGGVTQPLGSNVQVDASVAADRFESETSSDQSTAGELKTTWSPLPALKLWGESRYQFSARGNTVRPDHLGVGAGYQLSPSVSLEAVHRKVFMRGGVDDYSLTNLGVRSRLGAGTEAWSSYQIAGANGEYNAALIGLRTNVKLDDRWSVGGMLERRKGLGNAVSGDPVRALPFLQPEEDYWSVGLGAEFLPLDAPFRASARGEYRDGDFRSTRLLTVAGDVSLNKALAVLSRQEYLESDQHSSTTSALYSRRFSSLWGLAFRPIDSDKLNLLAKVEYVDAVNPVGAGVLIQRGDEGRTILVGEAIYTPTVRSEVGLRYAMRRTAATFQHTDGVQQALSSTTDYVGWRGSLDLSSWYGVRGEGRLLMQRSSGATRWDLAPEFVVFPLEGFEVAAGYRFGDLTDPDFAVRGGHGAFVTVGVRVTEKIFPTTADFWRQRFGR